MRQILRASAIMGGSSIATILAGVARAKIIALLLGPSGVGLLGLYRSFITVSSMISGLGISTPGISTIANARARGDEKTPGQVRVAIETCSAVVSLIGAIVLAIFREPLSHLVFAGEVEGASVGWLGLGVMAMTVSAGQIAVLNGLRRLGDMALVAIFSAVASTLVAFVAVWRLEDTGILIGALAIPVTSLTASTYFVVRAFGPPRASLSREILFKLIARLVRPGVVFMATGLISLIVPLIIRVILTNKLGLPATGYFEAAWGISMLYLGFILQAMGTDYFPRLSEVSADRARISSVFNEQIEASLLLAAPAIVGMLTLAPLVINILYSDAFTPSVEILRWQLLGDVFKVIGWSMSIVLLAQTRQFEFFIVETIWAVSYIATLYVGLGPWGLEAAGIGFLLSYVVYAGCLWAILHRTGTIRPERKVLVLAGVILAISVAVSVVAPIKGWGLGVGLVCTAGLAAYSFRAIMNHLRNQGLPS
jgi:PST family polysaccharide transporter